MDGLGTNIAAFLTWNYCQLGCDINVCNWPENNNPYLYFVYPVDKVMDDNVLNLLQHHTT